MTDLTGLAPAERHRAVAAGFADVIAAVADWSVAAPVDGWRTGDIVDHLLAWFPDFLEAGGVRLTPIAFDDRGAAWRARSAEIQGLLDGPSAAEQFTHPMIGSLALANAIDQFYTADVFMHTWDLATAAGLEPNLDPVFAEQLLSGMQPIEELLRGSGQYGPAVPVPADADPVSRLMGFIGRNPG